MDSTAVSADSRRRQFSGPARQEPAAEQDRRAPALQERAARHQHPAGALAPYPFKGSHGRVSMRFSVNFPGRLFIKN